MRTLITIIFICLCQPTYAACRHALVLALDISGSVNPQEYRLQLDGLANALIAKEVQEVLFAMPDDPISISVFVWSSKDHQRLVLNWVDIDNPATLQVIAERLRNYNKDRVTLKTAIGEALLFSKSLLQEKQDCWRRTIDVSGDGTNNDGPKPKEVYENHDFDGITVNGLVVTVDKFRTQTEVFKLATDLQIYFDHNILHGFDSFSMPALGYEDFERAMTLKLLRELAPAMIGKSGNTDLRFANKLEN